MKKLTKRHQFPDLLNELGLLGEAAEIGVAAGGFSLHMLSVWRGSRLHMIDCWQQLGGDEYHDCCNINDDQQEERYQKVVNGAKKYGSRAVIHRGFSKAVAETMPDNALDFVYIDANHKYEAVAEDLRIWWPKVRARGILAGHDYLDGELPSGSYGVRP